MGLPIFKVVTENKKVLDSIDRCLSKQPKQASTGEKGLEVCSHHILAKALPPTAWEN